MTAYAFELAAFRTTTDYPGGAKALGAVVDINGTVLAHKVSLTDTTNHLTVAQARTIMQATDDYRMLMGLAQDLDHVCIAVAGLGDAGMVGKSIAVAAREFGEYLTAVSTAVADDSVTPNELRRIDRELGEMQAAANRLRAACAALSIQKGRS